MILVMVTDNYIDWLILSAYSINNGNESADVNGSFQ